MTQFISKNIDYYHDNTINETKICIICIKLSHNKHNCHNYDTITTLKLTKNSINLMINTCNNQFTIINNIYNDVSYKNKNSTTKVTNNRNFSKKTAILLLIVSYYQVLLLKPKYQLVNCPWSRRPGQLLYFS